MNILNSLSRHACPSNCSAKSRSSKQQQQHQSSPLVQSLRQCHRESITSNCLPRARPDVTRNGQGASGSSIDEVLNESSKSSSNGTGSSRPELISTPEPQVEQLQRLDAPPMSEARYEILAAWVAAAVAFGAGIWYVQGAEKSAEFFAGYLLEQSLSVGGVI